ncbi:MAG TPA: tRNA uridine-5-carboxymethylaminomethyl(34) synthesis enzyme MnmG [Candidatus Paceibacterota bacterium]|nr:tRNA uridine-5-carboxymethylaminomethyl(34) synthesis enzyme MnmG [Verrucomicrobiota bacterium]HRZ43895.1 tRNA uridine-5-carboxymethylaminomethyl(34) synthesis enzyme MnmG [Candidatus Paceibacterota bacterium]
MFTYPKEYEVIVVGGGHAGIEAALASARMGCQTLLLTANPDTIGQMSCNPAIGGLAKGHLAREIDALGGEMGKTTDMTGLQFRMLNTKKGPSVWAPRAQCDKKAYQFRMKWVCERQANLDLKQAQVTRLLVKDNVAHGVETELGIQFRGQTVLLTTGTFLRGLMHIGSVQIPGGRGGEATADGLSESLKEIGLELGRLKTGTPPRVLRKSIDFSKTEVQPGDEPVPYFTYWPEDLFHVEHFDRRPGVTINPSRKYPLGSVLDQIGGQLPCHVTYTTDRTASLIRENLHLSPLYGGSIKGIGPRYCPSIEDKIVKFPEKERHQIFLEPEGAQTEEIYVNGCSTSLPIDVQYSLVRTIIGCENAEILRPAYAVEYDFAPPTQLHPWLETKICHNLFHAGQINGTSGYEEAAAQGLMAGINAVLKIRGLQPFVLGRDQAYTGVLIDDLVTKGTTEPYRMFTSRAEFRLLLRHDNADMRLCDYAFQYGLLPAVHYERFKIKRQAIQDEIHRLESSRHGSSTLAQILRRPEHAYRDLPSRNDQLPAEVIRQVEIEVKYAGYIERQIAEVNSYKSLETKMIPDWIDYDSIRGLRIEARHKLRQIHPRTIGQASRISGVSPADLSLVMVWIKRGLGNLCR